MRPDTVPTERFDAADLRARVNRFQPERARRADHARTVAHRQQRRAARLGAEAASKAGVDRGTLRLPTVAQGA